jgi:spore germination protein GerM
MAFAKITGGSGSRPQTTTSAPQVTVLPLTDATRPLSDAHGSSPSLSQKQPQSLAPLKTAPAATNAPSSEKPAERKARLYFAVVDPDGKLLLKSVIRSIPASDSPLRDTLRSLLKGPTAQELNLGLISMIPPDANLRSVIMQGDTAVIDFSESFRFNAQGIDAMDAQLRQVVYAATEFPSVKSVQIRIEGKTVRYLDSEGVRIDEPLSRTSFQN